VNENPQNDTSQPLQRCIKCGGELRFEFVERETAAGDYVNEYRITKCQNPICRYEHEEWIGGHCSEGWNVFG